MPTYVLSLLGRDARAGMLEALPAGMRLGHLAVLGALADRDSSSQRELGALLALHPTDLVAIIDDLVDRSLAEREVDPADRRRRLVRITPTGQELVAECTTKSVEVVEQLLAGLPRPDQATVMRLLTEAIERRSGQAQP
ncbi:MarR family winged helix-turn-helix transcriptional regulator [Microbacterium sp. B19]|uniref:MarR family winged helix-turn-helix transcriptional regulator n=1 Tax=Microbacterium sp. B19 TaxID=96765 RepID=UPI0016516B71|nr:MarR family winged helix-turn-helix transcriptional regulator [Microbacterium sp. B19]